MTELKLYMNYTLPMDATCTYTKLEFFNRVRKSWMAATTVLIFIPGFS